jgi:glucan 1,3-beta-glucosidase
MPQRARACAVCAALGCTISLACLIALVLRGAGVQTCLALVPNLDRALARADRPALQRFRTCVLPDPFGVADPLASAWATRHGRLRGVNLGGWLLQERWLMGGRPSVVTACCGEVESPYNGTECSEAESELELTRLLRARGELRKMDAFRDAFITEADFARMAAVGVNAVRLPIGYWLVDPGLDPGLAPDDGYYQGAGLRHVDDAVAWAEGHGLKLMLELHGAVGGQSGQQTTGFRDTSWNSLRFDPDGSVEALRVIAARYAGSEAVIALGLLNEPELPAEVLLGFYRKAIPAVRWAGMRPDRVAIVINLYSHEGLASVLSDGWRLFNDELTAARGFVNLVYDLHLYYAFLPDTLSDSEAVSIGFVTSELVDVQSRLLQLTGRPTLTGEWSLRVPHPGTVPGAEFARLDRLAQALTLKAFATRQVRAISVTRPDDRYARIGGFYWTWTGPAVSTIRGRGCVSGDQTQWSFTTALERGWFADGEWAA